MVHPLVKQLRFTRSEWIRGLEGVSAEDAVKRLQPMNCISWMVGHLASQEHRFWCVWGQDKVIAPEVDQFKFGQPASTPHIDEVWALWHTVTKAADFFLDDLTTENLLEHLVVDDEPLKDNTGTLLQRMTYHYWYHLGEGLAVRQILGHSDLPQFVGNMSNATYQPD